MLLPPALRGLMHIQMDSQDFWKHYLQSASQSLDLVLDKVGAGAVDLHVREHDMFAQSCETQLTA